MKEVYPSLLPILYKITMVGFLTFVCSITFLCSSLPSSYRL